MTRVHSPHSHKPERARDGQRYQNSAEAAHVRAASVGLLSQPLAGRRQRRARTGRWPLSSEYAERDCALKFDEPRFKRTMARFEHRFVHIETDLTELKWMVGTLIIVTVGGFGALLRLVYT
jgi:hypothetical protein